MNRANPHRAILRTAWVVIPHRANFVQMMLRPFAERDGFNVVADQHDCPTCAADLAAALKTVTLRLVADWGAPTGTFHCVNAGETTWHCFESRCRGQRPARRPERAGVGHPDLGPLDREAGNGLGHPHATLQVAPDNILDGLVGPVATGV